MSDAAFIFYAAECRDFCVFLLPEHWLADRKSIHCGDFGGRGMQHEKKTVFILPSAKNLSWQACVKHIRKRQDLFAKISLKPHNSGLVEKLYEAGKTKKTAANAMSDNDLLELALKDAISQDGL
ncbi:hypothetical protein CYMTET_18410 [Cymbomonas tetramitiformis]|uniref:Uncharacterized protein n=1 Tax=Cymbomonas tetramitiformis TaxID=36881 RepID=A0AAE0G837_9CHLO|nr:hypothetical protein CYMTET_18410 [Cymbomonas tetramitiformis]